ncbi:MAG: hypothetical protein M0R74_20585 [Dehalococcoidia bacterium]|nr:hypothetical protein [Dehalococcoidia bacterium]
MEVSKDGKHNHITVDEYELMVLFTAVTQIQGFGLIREDEQQELAEMTKKLNELNPVRLIEFYSFHDKVKTSE